MNLIFRWSWERWFLGASGQIFWNSFAICWCCLFGSYFVWLSSWVWPSLFWKVHALLDLQQVHINFLFWVGWYVNKLLFFLSNWLQICIQIPSFFHHLFLCWNVSLCDISMLWSYIGFFLALVVQGCKWCSWVPLQGSWHCWKRCVTRQLH